MSMTVGSLIAYMGLDDSQFKSALVTNEADFQAAGAKMETTSIGIGAAFTKAAKVSAIAGGVLAAGIGVSVKGYADFAINVAKVNAQTNLGVKATSQLVGQMNFLHANTSTLGVAAKTLEKSLGGLEVGTKADVTAFGYLGLSWSQLKNLSPADQLALVRDRISQMHDVGERAIVTQTLLGRGAKDMSLWYTASGTEIDKINKELAANGQILTTQQVDAARKAGAEWEAFTGSLKGFEYALAQDVLPALGSLAGDLSGVVDALRPYAGLIPPIALALLGFAAAVKTVSMAQTAWRAGTVALMAAQALWRGVQYALAIATGDVSIAELKADLANKDLTLSTAAQTDAETAQTTAVVANTDALAAESEARIEAWNQTTLSTTATAANSDAEDENAVVKGRLLFSSDALNAATVEGTAATEAGTGATEASTGALKAGIITAGLYVAAIAAIAVEVYLVVKAYDSWKSAAQQAATAAANASQQLASAQAAGKTSTWGTAQGPAGSQSAGQISSAINAEQYKSPSTMGRVGLAIEQTWKDLGKIVPGMADGGIVKPQPGGTIVRLAEKGKAEAVVDASSLGSSAAPVFTFPSAQFMGEPSPAIADRWAKALGDAFMRRVVPAVGGVNVG